MDRTTTQFTSSHDSEAALREHLLPSLRELWRGYRRGLKQCQKRFSEKSVHALRVATRRLLSKIDLLEFLLADDNLSHARRILKKRLNAFNDLRDTQVQLLRVKASMKRRPELKSFYRWLRRREKRLIKSASKKVAASSTSKLAKCIKQISKTLQSQFSDSDSNLQCSKPIQAALVQTFSRLITLRQHMDPTDTNTIHRTRLVFKKYRYLVESLYPVLPGMTKKDLGAMHDYQSRMGEIQDAEVMLARLDDLDHKKKFEPDVLKKFRNEMQQQRTRCIRTYLDTADDLYSFRPLALRPTFRMGDSLQSREPASRLTMESNSRGSRKDGDLNTYTG